MRSHALTPRPMKVIDVAGSGIGQFLVVNGIQRCMLDHLRLACVTVPIPRVRERA